MTTGSTDPEVVLFAREAVRRCGAPVDVVDDYAALHRWSVERPDDFWALIWSRFDVQASVGYDRVVDETPMPGTRWFVGARLNYVDQVLRHSRQPMTSPADGHHRRGREPP